MVIGCTESSRPQDVPAEPTAAPVLLPFTSLDAGDRPASINGADYKEIHFFHQNHPSAGKAVCIEGTYSRRFLQFGTESTILKCPECETDVEVFGIDLLRYDIPVGSRILIRGQMPLKGEQIEDCTMVTQAAIDAALEKQATDAAGNAVTE